MNSLFLARDIWDIYELVKHLTRKDLLGLYESAFDKAKKEFFIIDRKESPLSQIHHINDKFREIIGNTISYKDVENLKNKIFIIYYEQLEGVVPKDTLRQFLDRLFEILEEKIISHPKISDELNFLRIKEIYQHTREIPLQKRLIEQLRKITFLLILLISFLSAVVVISLTSHYEIQDSGPLNYILSSISQGLAVIFALVFTVTLVATQILSKYSVRATSLIFSSWTVLLMFIFAGGIIGPLVAMKWQSELLLDLSIIWAGVCIFLLIPYFFYLKERLSPEWHIKSLLEKVNPIYIEQSESKTRAKYQFDIQDYPLFMVLQIMTRTLREGDYETFFSSLTLIRKRYQSTVNKDNSRFLGFQFINVLARLGKKIIIENEDFLLLRVCFTLKGIAVFNANQKLLNINTRISSLMAAYLEIAYLQEDFNTIVLEIQEIIEDMCAEYVKSGSEFDFLNQVIELRQRSGKMAEKASPQEIYQFINFIQFLARIALSGGLPFLRVVKDLSDCIQYIGIESAGRRLRLPYENPEIESRLSECSAEHLERILDDLQAMKDQTSSSFEESKMLPILEETISEIQKYISKIRDEQFRHGSKIRDNNGDYQ